MKESKSKKKIMLHIIMPKQISGPNTSSKIIAKSYLSDKYDFVFLTQHFHAGGKINVKLIIELFTQIRNEKPDIIHLNGLQASGFHAAIAARMYNKSKVLMTIRGFSSDSLEINNRLKIIHKNFIEPITLKIVDRFYTVCKYAGSKKLIYKNSEKYYGYIHNSAPKINNNYLENSVRKELGISKSEIIVTAASRIVKDKGYSYLVEPIKSVLNTKTNVTFLIVGDGKYLDSFMGEFESYIKKDKIKFLKQRDDVVNILLESNIFVFPTLHENLSNSLLEAASTKNAIIATRVGGNPEVIIDEYNGLLVEPRDSNALLEKLLYLINNEKFRIKLAENAVSSIKEKFSQERNIKKLNELYEDLLKGVENEETK